MRFEVLPEAAIGARRVLWRVTDRLAATAEERRALAGLCVLAVFGLVPRLLLVVAWRPVFLGYPDAAVYTDAARGTFGNPAIPDTVFFDKMRPAGYPIFLRILHAISPELTFVALAQHLLGIAAAMLLYATVRRLGAPAWLGLVPAGFVLLGGTEIFIEHAALTEALYIFLQSAALYGAVRALDSPDPGWAAGVGFLMGAAADVRFQGLALIPLFAIWLLLARPDSWEGRLLHAGALVAASAVMVGTYIYAQRQATGFTGLTQAGQWNLYGRVAQFADCSKFTPPKGTEVLCENTPPSQRPGPDEYIFIMGPARDAFGGPDWGDQRISSLEDNAKIAAWARAVIIHQPADYLRTIAHDMVRYVFPQLIEPRLDDGLTSEQLIGQLVDQRFANYTIDVGASYYYKTGHVAQRAGLLDALRTYERGSRFQGVLMLLLLLLSLAGPFVTQGRLRAGTVLLTLLTIALMVTPVATIFWDARLAIPVYGVLGASAAIGGWALWTGRGRLVPEPPRPA